MWQIQITQMLDLAIVARHLVHLQTDFIECISRLPFILCQNGDTQQYTKAKIATPNNCCHTHDSHTEFLLCRNTARWCTKQSLLSTQQRCTFRKLKLIRTQIFWLFSHKFLFWKSHFQKLGLRRGASLFLVFNKLVNTTKQHRITNNYAHTTTWQPYSCWLTLLTFVYLCLGARLYVYMHMRVYEVQQRQQQRQQ